MYLFIIKRMYAWKEIVNMSIAIGWAPDMIGWACAQPFPSLATPLGIRNKYCYTCSIAQRSSKTALPHHCYKNWAQSSCAMESNIIVKGFKSSEKMHGL